MPPRLLRLTFDTDKQSGQKTVQRRCDACSVGSAASILVVDDDAADPVIHGNPRRNHMARTHRPCYHNILVHMFYHGPLRSGCERSGPATLRPAAGMEVGGARKSTSQTESAIFAEKVPRRGQSKRGQVGIFLSTKGLNLSLSLSGRCARKQGKAKLVH
jgi:hypothetical protein